MMPVKKRQSKRRADGPEPTEVEWLWLIAAEDANPFLGFGRGVLTTPDRLASLWTHHRAEILTLWRDDPPGEIPPYHPVLDEIPAELAEPTWDPPSAAWNDPPWLPGEFERARERYEAEFKQNRRRWLQRRREWFRRHR